MGQGADRDEVDTGLRDCPCAREVALTGVDFISVGALTHSVKVFDIGMDLVED